MSSDTQRRNRYLALVPGPLFLCAAAYFYDQTGMAQGSSHGWQYTHLTKIGTLPLSLSDYNFLATIFCAVCGVIYFVLGAVARRPVELFFAYLHSGVSLAVVAAVAYFIGNLPVADSIEPIPAPYVWIFLATQLAFFVYAAMAILRPPPDY